MNIYRLDADVNRYQNLSFVDENDWEILQTFDGRLLSNTWAPLRIYIPDEYKNRPLTDTPGFSSHVPIFSSHAVASLRDILLPCGELLELKCPDGKYYAYNATRMVSINEEKSVIKRFKDGHIMDILRYEFIPNQIDDTFIFKVSQMPLGHVFVNEKVIHRINDAGLIGFEFPLVWHD